MSGVIDVRAVKAIQGKGTETYSFFLRGSEVLKIADISRIHRDELGELKGFQRKEIQNHVNSIVDYLDKGDVIFPNALILAFQSELEFKQSRGKSPDGAVSGTLYIPTYEGERRAAWIVDGQQRSFALAKTMNKDIMVPVVGFVAPDISVQREQFILVNKARPLPKRLINELLPEIDTELPHDLKANKIPSELCNILNRDKNSPFFGLIKRTSNEDVSKTAVITDTAIIDMIKHSKDNYGALALYKNSGNNTPDIESMYKTICLFWGAVKEVFPEAWGRDVRSSRLMHSAGILAMGVLMDRIMPKVQNTRDVRSEVIRELQIIAPYCSWTSGNWGSPDGRAWNSFQNTSRDVREFRELLMQIYYSQVVDA